MLTIVLYIQLLSQEKNVSRSTSEAQHAVEARLADAQEHLLTTRRDLSECREDLREREERIERLDARVTKLSEHIKRKDDILRRQVNIANVEYIHVLYLVFHYCLCLLI